LSYANAIVQSLTRDRCGFKITPLPQSLRWVRSDKFDPYGRVGMIFTMHLTHAVIGKIICLRHLG